MRKLCWIVGALVVAMGLTALVQGVLLWLNRNAFLSLMLKLSVSLSSQFLWHALRLPVSYFEARYPGDMAMRVEINQSIARLLSRELVQLAISLVMVLRAREIPTETATPTFPPKAAAREAAPAKEEIRDSSLARRETLPASIPVAPSPSM